MAYNVWSANAARASASRIIKIMGCTGFTDLPDRMCREIRTAV